jgi:hypothetical protein
MGFAYGGMKWVNRGAKILEGPHAIRAAAHVFGVDYNKLRRYIERDLKDWLGGADNVRFKQNGDILPPVGEDAIGNVYDILE